MLAGTVMAKLEGANQAALLSSLAGKSYTVGQVTTTGNGLGTCLLLTPDAAGAASGQGIVALKLEGTRQMAQMSGLVGKSVTIGNAPVMAGGVGHWATFCPNAGVAAKGLTGVGAAGLGQGSAAHSQLVMLKLEGASSWAQAPALTGKTFTVAKSTAATGEAGKWLFLQPIGDATVAKDIVALKVQGGSGQLPWLVGKTFTVGNGPIVAADNAGKYLFLQPVTGAAGKSAVVAAKGITAARLAEGATVKGIVPAMKAVALKSVGGGTAALTAGKAVTVSAVAKTTAAAGTIWAGTGLSLGLGLGLGSAGPLVLGGLIAAAGYGIHRYRKGLGPTDADIDDELRGALS